MKARAVHDPQIHAIVPVNLLRKAKSRLSLVLSRAEREQLTLAMLTNVLRALHKSRRITDITVVSTDRKIPAIAHRYGARFLWEGSRHGLNKALRKAIAVVEREGDGAMMIIHSDLPLLTERDITRFLARSSGCEVAVVPCKENSGTNALLLTRPNALPLSFGKESFEKHVSYARRKKLRYKVVRLTGIQFDIDKPEDLRQFMHRRVPNETQRYLFALMRAKPGGFRAKSRLFEVPRSLSPREIR
jgi:2-phospho-L-lactate guanylyltransferase